MFFLNAAIKGKRFVILHVRGNIKDDSSLFLDGEGIFEVKPEFPAGMRVVRQVGTVKIEEGKTSFEYTDPNFKQEINYNEVNGYSTLDGSAWEMKTTAYYNNSGTCERTLRAETENFYMYRSAKDPIANIGPLSGLVFEQEINLDAQGSSSQAKARR